MTKGGARARGALHPDPTAMQLNHGARDRQAQAAALVAARRLGLRTIESLEDASPLGCWNPRAVVRRPRMRALSVAAARASPRWTTAVRPYFWALPSTLSSARSRRIGVRERLERLAGHIGV